MYFFLHFKIPEQIKRGVGKEVRYRFDRYMCVCASACLNMNQF